MKLHIGGEQPKEGWKILNAQQKPGVDILGDLTNLTQFKDNTVEEIYASHVLEHIPQNDVLNTLKEIYRILIPHGVFYVSVPDMDVLAHTFISPNRTPDDKFHVMKMMFGGQVDKFDYHFFGWNQCFLTNFLTFAGFKEINRVETFGLFSDTSEYKPWGIPISLNMIAKK